MDEGWQRKLQKKVVLDLSKILQHVNLKEGNMFGTVEVNDIVKQRKKEKKRKR